MSPTRLASRSTLPVPGRDRRWFEAARGDRGGPGDLTDRQRALRCALATLVTVLVLMCGAGFASLAADSFPALTGRVVDGASVLSQTARERIEAKLKDLEDKSSIQLVVATVPSLGGQEIEPYANALFRAWKLGEAKTNNGVLLLVAPKERRVRIEVGYGLEGTLTDALSKIIITNAMVPRFKTGDFAGGIERGADDIVTVLSTDTSDWQKRPEFRAQDEGSGSDVMMILVIALVFGFTVLYLSRQAGRRFGGPGGIVFLPTGGSSWGGGGGVGGGFGGGGGGGFSGGGGSSGGGGASGGW